MKSDVFWREIAIMAAGALFVAVTLIITACVVQEGCCLYNIVCKSKLIRVKNNLSQMQM